MLTINSSAQTNYLNKKISLSEKNIKVQEALILISKQGEFNFSYNANVVNGDSIVSIKVKKQSVEKTLNSLFNNTIRYRQVNQHIILLPNEEKKTTQQKRKSYNTTGYTISGYVMDANTGERIANASVYEVDGQFSTLTNGNGFYMIVVPSDRSFRGFTYAHYNYLDSVLFLRPEGSIQIDVTLKPRQKIPEKIQLKTTVLEHDLESRTLVTWLVPQESMNTAKNITVADKTTAQVSLLPFIGSNQIVAGSHTNNLSLNVLAGYTGAVDGVEVGGLVNIVQNNVKGAQIAGLGNIVGKETQGAQLAGLFNVNNGSVTGAQLAGFSNTLNGEMHGAQISGFNNYTTNHVDGLQITGFANIALKDVKLVQLSGFINYGRNIGGLQATGFANIAMGDVNMAQLAGFYNQSKDVNGLQAAGFINVAQGNIGAAQLAGFMNYCDSVTGAQVAGFGNVARMDVNAVQAAGFFNYGKSVTGTQIAGFGNTCLTENKGLQLAGFFNIAQKLKGVQISLFNFCDTVESGVPIGLFSFVLKGYHKLELSTDEVFYTNAIFKTGTKRFYNQIGVGWGYHDLFNYTYGVGFASIIKKNNYMNYDFKYSGVHSTNNAMELLGTLLAFQPSYTHIFHKYFEAFAGFSLRYYIAKPYNEAGDFVDIAFKPIIDIEGANYRQQVWFGLQAGVRF